MLTAFSAKPLLELRQRDKSKIESILAYGDKLLVGLNTGSLRIYRVNEQTELPPSRPQSINDDRPSTPTKPRLVDLLREEEKFSRRPIQQLSIIKEASILVALYDNHVSLHDLQTYQLQERLDPTKGATLFAVTSNIVKDESTGIPSIVSRLAVVVKRKLLIWSWQDMEMTGDVQEIVLTSTAKSLTWATGTKIVAGLDSGFVLVDTISLEISDVVKHGSAEEVGAKFGAVSSTGMGYVGMGSWVPKPMSFKLHEQEVLLAKDVNTLFIDANGKSLEKRQVPWPTAPEAIGYSYPYLLALQAPTRGNLEVRNPETLSLLQTIPLPNAALMHVPQPNISLAHAGKGFLVASDRIIWRMSAIKYESQIETMVAQEQYDEAISLASLLEDTLLLDKEDRIRDIKILKAQTLFAKRKFRDSIDLFIEAAAAPQSVIAMYPRTIAGDLADQQDEAIDTQDNGDGHTADEGGKSVPNSPKATPRKTVLGRFLGDSKKPEADAASVKSATTDDGQKASEKAGEKVLEGRDLVLAVNELCAFLAQTRVKMQKIISPDGKLKQPLTTNTSADYKPDFHRLILLDSEESLDQVDWHAKLLDVASIVDTTLFRAYMLARPGLAGSLFRLDNFCNPQVVREKLYETGRYADLIDFLHGKKLHREALEMLEKFGKDVDNDSINPSLRGPQRTVAYLQQLPPAQLDLILEYADWPLRKDNDVGMQVFLADTENAETLPRDKVLHFLQDISSRLATKYLEHVILELNDQTADFHQRLIDLYLDRLKLGRDAKPEYGGFKDDEEKLECRTSLEQFLRYSQHYNRAKVFSKIQVDDPDFYESRAIVLSKMGQHKQALQVYVFQLKDYSKAEEYCNQTYLATQDPLATLPAVPLANKSRDAEDAPSIYHTLLSLYLSPPPPHQPNLEPALELLAAHGARLPASQTLSLIPPSLSISTLESYFTGRIRTANSVLNQERIVAQLRAVVATATEESYAVEKNRRVVVGEDRLCPVCHKRFGASAVRVWPDGKVVHYGCFDRGTGPGASWTSRQLKSGGAAMTGLTSWNR